MKYIPLSLSLSLFLSLSLSLSLYLSGKMVYLVPIKDLLYQFSTLRYTLFCSYDSKYRIFKLTKILSEVLARFLYLMPYKTNQPIRFPVSVRNVNKSPVELDVESYSKFDLFCCLMAD